MDELNLAVGTDVFRVEGHHVVENYALAYPIMVLLIFASWKNL